MPSTQGDSLNYLTNLNPITIVGARVYDKANQRWQNLSITTYISGGFGHVEAFSNCIRLFVDSSTGVTHLGGQDVVVYYIQE